MAGAGETLKAAGCRLVGGHSGEGEMGFGLSVNGWADPQRLVRKGGAGAGDVLILTKPLGTGVLFAADMRGEARSEWVAAALSEMRRSNQAAARILAPHATSGTDVTGFGLAGHLLEMLRASSLGAELRLDRIPTLAGARDLLNRGFASTLQSENVALAEAAIDGAAPPILFDPQTAGGLLMSVPESAADGCLRDLRAEGYEAAAVGNMRPRNGAKLIAVR
jgi:selenide,water dikinase